MTATPLIDVPGLLIGHWSDLDARTGCTVLSFDQQALTAVEVRGAAPGTRELDAFAPGRTVQRADAILLTGGSAFGLRAADGVVDELRSRGRGYPTPAGPVPIVPSAVIFDLAVGTSTFPTAEDGRSALLASRSVGEVEQGAIGAGTGARFGTITGNPQQGGVGVAQQMIGQHSVTAIVVLNAFGSLLGQGSDPRPGLIESSAPNAGPGEATTLISIVTSFPCDHGTLQRLCIAAHDALARTIVPSHTMLDGDVAFGSTLSEGQITLADALRLGVATELAVESAIVNASRSGT